jgi:hypothetical protein
MSVWRQKAITCAPELKTVFQDPDLTPYDVFMELFPLLEQAHINQDQTRLTAIYQFAAWCLQQKHKNLWNAAGVCFYEHLVDSELTFQYFTQWIKKDIYVAIRNLLILRATDAQMKQLDGFYGLNK